MGAGILRQSPWLIRVPKVTCHFSTAHPADDVRIYHKECTSLARVGWKVYLRAQVPDNDIAPSKVDVRILKKRSRSRVHRILCDGWRNLRSVCETNATIIHIHDPELIPVGFALKLARRQVIYDVHEDLPRDIMEKTWIPSLARWPIARLAEIFEHLAARTFDGVVAATPTIRKRFDFLRERAITVKNYPLVSEFAQEPPAWEERADQACYVGKITLNRGYSEITAASAIAKVPLVVAGSCHPVGLIKGTPDESLPPTVHYVGHLNRTQTIQLLYESKVGLVLLHPTRGYYDSLPVKLFEYMAAGLPIIASDFPSWRKIIDEFECGVCVNPLDSAGIAHAISDLMQDPAKCGKMSARGRQAFLERFSWSSQFRRLERLYDRLDVD